MVLSYILQNCPLDFEPYTSSIVLTVAGTLVTALWEELYFRYVGCSLFEENGKYKWYNVIFLALMFMGIHLINVYFNGWAATQNQLMFTFSLGIFLLALYIQTKSIIVPIIGHFCVMITKEVIPWMIETAKRSWQTISVITWNCIIKQEMKCVPL